MLYSLFLLIKSMFTYFSIRVSRIFPKQFLEEVMTYMGDTKEKERRKFKFSVTEMDWPQMASQSYQEVAIIEKNLEVTAYNYTIVYRNTLS